MSENRDAIYQSGEKSPFSGTFEVVGVRLAHAPQGHKNIICELKAGKAFPTYEGLEVCWHLVGSKRQNIESSGSSPFAKV